MYLMVGGVLFIRFYSVLLRAAEIKSFNCWQNGWHIRYSIVFKNNDSRWSTIVGFREFFRALCIAN